MNREPDPLGPLFPGWLQTRADIATWTRVAGVRALWDDRQVLAPGTEVCYEDCAGNRLVCRVERSGFMPLVPTDRGAAGTTATVLVPVRFERGGMGR